MPASATREHKVALLGYSPETMQAAKSLGYDFVAVVPPGFETGLEAQGVRAVAWDYERRNEDSADLYVRLKDLNCSLAIPLYEETVEWAGAINARFRDDPRLFNRTLLLRDKAMMKRKAQMSGIRVGVFEEVDTLEHLRRFFRRVNEADSRLPGDQLNLVHVKPLRAAGSVGHRVIHTEADVDDIPEDELPMLAESHLGGQEFSVEAFIHDGKVRFMNINEYVHLGYNQLTPGGHGLEVRRTQIRKAVEHLIRAFDIRYGVIHPEYFVDAEGELAFGEVANRVPGGNIFQLIQRAYGFDPFEALLLASDPSTTEDELAAFFPDEVDGRQGYAGNLLVFPKKERVEALELPSDLLEHPYYESHNLFQPLYQKVAPRHGFGDHYGVVNFFGADPETLRETLSHFEAAEFYV